MVILTMTATSSGVVGEVTNQAERDASVGGKGGFFVGDQVWGAAVVDGPTIDGHSTATIERSLTLIRATLPPKKLDDFNHGLRLLSELDFATRDTLVLQELMEGECVHLTEYRQTTETTRLSLSADTINGLGSDALIILSRVLAGATGIDTFLGWEIDC